MELTKSIVVILFSTLVIVGCNSSKIKSNNEMTKITDGYIFFDLYTMQSDKIYSTDELISMCNQYNVTTVPIILNIKNNQEPARFPTNINQSDDKLTKELSKFLKEG